ncbi:hypothetical protein [Gordonia sp. (in: high G+C Gram-positive bacteria)]|nr:hypothetical protein [Gordonia sp. (in: high G+C Gram-positive bacteria)]HMS75853.1 hypothetical protein [Gordonia sp. (in: high G+C Gram-positive bacteria)]
MAIPLVGICGTWLILLLGFLWRARYVLAVALLLTCWALLAW